MKIGISDGRKWGANHYLKLKSFGFDCFDINFASTECPPYTYDGKDFEEYLKNEKKLADEAGITIWQVHGPWRCPPIDGTPEDRAERMEKMKRSIQAASIVGAKYWVIHPIMPCGLEDVLTNQVEQTRELNLEFMSELLKSAKQEGVTICLENMPFPDFSLASPTATAEFVKEMNDPCFGMCLDTGHANIRSNWLTPAQTIRTYGEYVKSMHVHDNNGRRDEHWLPFCGNIDWNDFSEALKEVNFQGVLSLECAPSSNLPDGICEDMYSIYFRVAKSIAPSSK